MGYRPPGSSIDFLILTMHWYTIHQRSEMPFKYDILNAPQVRHREGVKAEKYYGLIAIELWRLLLPQIR